LKPPLLFYFFGLIETLAPHSFIAIRFAAVLVVFTSALLLLSIAKSKAIKNAFPIALLFVLLCSEFGSLQGLMSEHVAVFFILLGLWLFQKHKMSLYLLAGLAFGCALMCKRSYGYGIAAMIALFVLLEWKTTSFSRLFLACTVLLAGILIALALVALPYYRADEMTTFIDAVFKAPFAYGQAMQLSWIQKLQKTWWIILAGIALTYIAVRYAEKERRNFIVLVAALLLGTIYTFYSSGIVNGHYLILVYPFILLLLANLTKKQWQLRPQYLVSAVMVLSFESWNEYYQLIKNYPLRNSLHYRQSFQVVDELKNRKLDNKKIFFADYHIAYWMLNQYPLTKVTTHPSNLSRPYLFQYIEGSKQSSMEELQHLMLSVRPDVIVSRTGGLGFFSTESEEQKFFITQIQTAYQPLIQDTKRKIFMWERVSR